jgi:hypothetical protein
MTKIRYSLFLFFVPTMIILLHVGTTPGATFPVSTTAELRQALLSAADNGEADTILLADGTYRATDDGGGTFTFSGASNHDLTIRGSAPENVVLSGENTHGVLAFTADGATAAIQLVSVSVVKGSSTENGGGIYAAGLQSVTLNHCILSGNTAGGNGGGFYGSGPLTVTRSTISDNTAGSRGGGFYGGWPLTVSNSAITDNMAGSYGGGFYSAENAFGEKSATLTDCLISGNTAGESGGGFHAGGSSDRNTTVTNSIISDNTANTSGAGVFINGTAVVINSIVINSTAAEGIYLQHGTNNTILNSIFFNNDDYDVAGSESVSAVIHNNYIDESKIDISASDTANNINSGNLDFADETNGDFHIGSESILIDNGTTAVSGITFPETDYEGYSRIVGASIDIGPYEFSNTRPVINAFTYTGFPQVQSEIIFDIDATPYGDRTITKYEWDFDYDGVYDDGEYESSAPQSTHTFTAAGNYTVQVKVTDSSGEFSLGIMDILIIPISELPLAEKITDAFENNDSDAINDVVNDLFASGLSQNALAQAISEAFNVGLSIIAEKKQTIENLNTAIADKNLLIADLEETIASMFTQEELDQAVALWDGDGDGLISLADVIRCLQVLSGARAANPS